jgi:hypothetical protein
MDKVHCLAILLREAGKPDRRISAADQPEYVKGTYVYYVPDGEELRAVHIRTPAKAGVEWERMGMVDALRILEQADIRIAFNGQGFDEGPLVDELDPGLGAIPRSTRGGSSRTAASSLTPSSSPGSSTRTSSRAAPTGTSSCPS